MATHKVGGEVDAFCTRCKMTLAHTILAMVGTKIARVRCNTCNGDHAYRAEPGARSSTPRAAGTASASRARASGAVDKVTLSFQEQLAGKDLASAPMYSPKLAFILDQVVNHPTFGYGIVTAVRGDKVDIAFKGQQKTLVHGRGEAAAGPKPVFQPPAARRAGPADKPMSDEAAAEAAEPSDEGSPGASDEASEDADPAAES